MRYPTIRANSADAIVNARSNELHVDLQDHVKWTDIPGEENELDLSDYANLATDLVARLDDVSTSPRNKEALEAEFCPGFFRALQHVDVEILDDPGFWAYLAVSDLFRFVQWRENLATPNARKYFDGLSSTECVPLRMYQRGRLTSLRPELSTAIDRGTDFWRSHVIRVQTGSAPALTMAFAASQGESRMKTNTLREFAKRLNRLWTNVALQTYSVDEAKALVGEQRDRLDDQPV